jgi:hypothetical protein
VGVARRATLYAKSRLRPASTADIAVNAGHRANRAADRR